MEWPSGSDQDRVLAGASKSTVVGLWVMVNRSCADWHEISPGDSAIFGNAPTVQYPIVEIKHSGVHWMEPSDLSREELVKGLVSRSPHDERTHFVTSGSNWHVLERWRITLSGEETDWLREWPVQWVPDRRGRSSPN